MPVNADIQIENLTTAEVEGRGVFDELMRSAKSHIQSEFDKDRITGNNYSDVYLGTMQAVLAQSVQFLLQQGISSKQIEQLDAQIEQTKAQTALITKQELLIDKQMAQIDAEVALTEQRLLTEVENTKVQAANALNAQTQNLLLLQQIEKVKAELEVLAEQKFNAQAQRLDTVNGQPVAGSIGKQKELYQAQIDGFTRDAEQKLTKILLDVWSVSRTTNDAVVVPGNADNTSIDEVIAVARQGIGLSNP